MNEVTTHQVRGNKGLVVSKNFWSMADMSEAPLLHCSNGDTEYPTDDLKLRTVDGHDLLLCRMCRRAEAMAAKAQGGYGGWKKTEVTLLSA